MQTFTISVFCHQNGYPTADHTITAETFDDAAEKIRALLSTLATARHTPHGYVTDGRWRVLGEF